MQLYKHFEELEGVMLKTDERTGLTSVKYANLGVDWSVPYMLEARGLIITKQGEIVGRPYEKFFNYKELYYSELPDKIKSLSEWKDEPFVIMDKADGSLAIAYTYQDELFISSSGTVDGEMSVLFKDALSKYPKLTEERMLDLCREYTLSMEYVSPFKQIVLPYSETKFILHGARVTKTGEYVSIEKLKEISDYLGIEMIELYDKFEDLPSVLKGLGELEKKEGFVVWFTESNMRLKLKTEEYLKLHKEITPLTMGGFKTKGFIKTLAEMIAKDSLDDFMAQMAQYETGSIESKEIVEKVFSTCLKVSEDAEKDFKQLVSHAKEHKELYKKDKFKYHLLLVELFSQNEVFDESVGHKITSSISKEEEPEFLDFLSTQMGAFKQFYRKLETEIMKIEVKY